MTDKPFTHIGTPTSDTKRFRMRGKDVLSEIIGVKSFAETFYLLVTGRDLPENHVRTFDACMVILMDHGITPTALVARMVHDSLPDDIQLPMIAGAMMVGNKFAGTMAGAGAIFKEGAAHGGDKREWAAGVVKRFREEKKFIPRLWPPLLLPDRSAPPTACSRSRWKAARPANISSLPKSLPKKSKKPAANR